MKKLKEQYEQLSKKELQSIIAAFGCSEMSRTNGCSCNLNNQCVSGYCDLDAHESQWLGKCSNRPTIV